MWREIRAFIVKTTYLRLSAEVMFSVNSMHFARPFQRILLRKFFFVSVAVGGGAPQLGIV